MADNHYIPPGSNNLKIPTREEFHRYTSNYITDGDFLLYYPPDPGLQIAKIVNALSWTKRNNNAPKYLLKRKPK